MTAVLVVVGLAAPGSRKARVCTEPTPRQRVADLRYLLRIWRACSHPLG